jgi:hypothetical protein
MLKERVYVSMPPELDTSSVQYWTFGLKPYRAEVARDNGQVGRGATGLKGEK